MANSGGIITVRDIIEDGALNIGTTFANEMKKADDAIAKTNQNIKGLADAYKTISQTTTNTQFLEAKKQEQLLNIQITNGLKEQTLALQNAEKEKQQLIKTNLAQSLSTDKIVTSNNNVIISNNKVSESENKKAQLEETASKKAIKSNEDERISDLKLQKAREDAFDKFVAEENKKAQLENRKPKTSEEIVNQRILAKNADTNALATSKLAGAYRNLSAQVAIASEKYQNIIARGRTAEQTQKQFNREISNAQREFRELQNRVLKADEAVDKWGRTNKRSIGFAKDLIGSFGIVGGVQLIASITEKVYAEIKAIQSLDNALKTATGTSTNFYKQQAFLNDISERYGASINGLTKEFTNFYIASKDKLGGEEIRGIFESITKASSVLGLSLEARERSFYAINQMMSKGTVQAEELRQQLGDSLPNAFGIMVKAYQKLHPEMQITEESFRKLMKDGKILSSEVLPEFARQLEKSYGIELIDRVETLTAKQERLGNSFTNMVRRITEGDNIISSSIGNSLDVLTFGLNNIEKIAGFILLDLTGIRQIIDFFKGDKKL